MQAAQRGFGTGLVYWMIWGALICLSSRLATGQTNPTVAWVTPPDPSYVVDVNTVIPLVWSVSNWRGMDLPYTSNHSTWMQYTVNAPSIGYLWNDLGQWNANNVNGDGTFSCVFTNLARLGSGLWTDTNIYFRARYASNGTFDSPVAAVHVRAHAPEIVSVEPTTVPLGVWTNLLITTKWVASSVFGTTVTLNGVTNAHFYTYGTNSQPSVDGAIMLDAPPSSTPQSVDLTIINPDNQRVTLPAAFSYVGAELPPTITTVAPTHGPTTGGTTVTITGANLKTNTTVKFGTANAAVTSVSADGTTLTCSTVAHASGAVGVLVQNSSGLSATLTNAFFYGVAVSSVFPNTGSVYGGTMVLIEGNGFDSNGVVVIFGTDATCQATNLQVSGSNHLYCYTPAHRAGTVDVSVFNPGTGGNPGDGALLAGGFTFRETPITIMSTERYTRTLKPATKTKPGLLIDSGQYHVVGYLDLTGYDTRQINRDTHFSFECFNDSETEVWKGFRMGDDLKYRTGDLKCANNEFDEWNSKRFTKWSATLNWAKKNTLKFSITGNYVRQQNLSTGDYDAIGYCLVAPNYLDMPDKSAAGLVPCSIWFDTILAEPLIPFVVSSKVTTSKSATHGTITNKIVIGVVGSLTQ